jgi:hypothetical protein
MVDYLRNQHIIDDLSPTEIDDIQKFIITPLRNRGALFHDMNQDVYFKYLNNIKIKINKYNDSGDITPVYSTIYQRMRANWEQPTNIKDNELETIIHRGVDKLIAQEKKRNTTKRKIRQKKIIEALENVTTLPTNVIRHISEYNIGKLRGERITKKNLNKSNSHKRTNNNRTRKNI